ncbi:MAG: hypothetical protein D8M57_11000 [Candidatus Scalindua sp. AMX11]|nr:MAG: hypothetical protein DWQ00_16055 [Candidatus Scalindua sp.]NOG83714.1 hypothetical protein [Planctomycetota bacterium]RZV73837.1 MAG: hypothetical protein EX341_13345 [Candidatus Scalindua sp. SCAELEC01]TDE64843.1 MAG: hypothetical protein D8M57_11000 [Candidatus Scalindua sp. AMX11]GJQ60669.1 MAG: hypothetical protein SCALA701_34700 [Candidatus Scalindua sp.]
MATSVLIDFEESLKIRTPHLDIRTMMKCKMFALIFFLLFSSLGNRIFAETNAIHETDTSNFEIYYPKDQDKSDECKDYVSILRSENRTIIDVSSEFGIGTVTIFLAKGRWPEKADVHLHLAGLEGFSVTNGKITLDLNEVSVKAFDNDGNLLDQKQHLKRDGFFEVTLPSPLFDKETREITISWVDFYRT